MSKLIATGLRALGKLHLLDNKIFVNKINLYGREWKVPLINRIGYDLAIGQQPELWLMEELRRVYFESSFNTFIDIGVNIGQTLLKVKSIDPNVRYIGFEPNPTCVFYTENLIQLNDIRNVSISCVGLGSAASIENLHYLGQEDTRATLHYSDTTPTDLIYQRQVAVWPLDSINLNIKDKEKIVMKIDVEGYELEVLKGATDFIRTRSPVIFFEALPHQQSIQHQQRSKDLFEWFQNNRYAVYLLEHSGKRIKINVQFDNPNDYNKTDFIAQPI